MLMVCSPLLQNWDKGLNFGKKIWWGGYENLDVEREVVLWRGGPFLRCGSDNFLGKWKIALSHLNGSICNKEIIRCIRITY